ncbi:hypothetical protein B488_11390 [Liberibacter crescens BT-1]|uniref:Uncharacterized protein n=2 Tax=Liberibacter crescens TaxID=1273132 RepID=L0EXN5_LIBCB|nr:hypothetical protein B488_11390 [Liberibacter crescens BT-1]
MRERIISAAKSGNLENLQPLLKENGKTTDLYVGQDSRDTNPIAILKELSSDTDGLEIMAILIDVLSTSLVQINAGSADEIYIWPYFAYKSIKELTASEKVDLLRLITAGDFSDMLELGEYSFYRVGIKPDGKWEFLKVGN